jgi:hypothetical protein
LGGGLDSRLMTLLCKKNIVAKSKAVKTGCNQPESFKKCYGTKRAVLPVMMIMIMMMIMKTMALNYELLTVLVVFV